MYGVLAQCKAEGIHTAVETALHVSETTLHRLLPLTDLVMMDIKLIDREKHKQSTGVDNTLILANARAVSDAAVPIIIRTPIVPGVNDTPEEVAAIARFVANLAGVRCWELLPFHQLGESKAIRLGNDCPARGLVPPTKEHMQQLRAVAGASGVPVL